MKSRNRRPLRIQKRVGGFSIPVVAVAMMLSGAGISDSIETPGTPSEAAGPKTQGSLTEAWSEDLPGRGRYNVLQIIWDTTRAANLGIYGYPRDTTPFLDRRAEEAGVVFERCHAEGSWTAPSVSTLFTGVIPQSHKVHTQAARLSDEWDTTAEILSANGYRTALISGNNMLMSKDRNFDQGFDEMTYFPRPDAKVSHGFLAWLDSTGTEPFFGHLQYFAAHGPYAPPSAFDSLFIGDEYYELYGDAPHINAAGCNGGLNPGIVVDNILNLNYYIAQYDALIRAADVEFERLMRGLESRGLLDSTLVILSADHGEMLAGEHNLYFCHASFFEGNSHVPLAIWMPEAWQAEHGRLGGTRDQRNVGLVDLMPTTLDLLDLPIPWIVQGTSLFSTEHPNMYLGGEADRRYVGFKDLKMIHHGLQVDSEEQAKLYKPIADPNERKDFASEDSVRTYRMAEALKLLSASAEGIWLPGVPGVYRAHDYEDAPDSYFKLYLDLPPSEDLYWAIRSTSGPDSTQAMYGYSAAGMSQSFETSALALVDDPQRSCRVEFDLKLDKGEVGIAVAYEPWIRTGYRVRLAHDRVILSTVWDGREDPLATGEVTLDPERWIRVRMTANSGTITFDVDGREVLRAFEPRWELIGGEPVFTMAPGTEVWIDNLELARP